MQGAMAHAVQLLSHDADSGRFELVGGVPSRPPCPHPPRRNRIQSSTERERSVEATGRWWCAGRRGDGEAAQYPRAGGGGGRVRESAAGQKLPAEPAARPHPGLHGAPARTYPTHYITLKQPIPWPESGHFLLSAKHSETSRRVGLKLRVSLYGRDTKAPAYRYGLVRAASDPSRLLPMPRPRPKLA